MFRGGAQLLVPEARGRRLGLWCSQSLQRLVRHPACAPAAASTLVDVARVVNASIPPFRFNDATAAYHHTSRRGIATAATSNAFGDRVSPSAVAGAVGELRAAGLHVVSADDPDPDAAREVALKSRDFFWYSPTLKESLKGQRGDAVVVARDEADVIAVAGCAARRGVPLVARGAGTGNYGQAVPLRGGIVLDLSNLRDVVSFDAEEGVVRAGAGANLADLEDHVRARGWELRQHPSTRRTATLGGFIAGGSTGVGALLHGGLAEDGAVAGLRVVTAEETPRVLELEGRDVFPVGVRSHKLKAVDPWL